MTRAAPTHTSPVLGCRCRACHAERVAIYRDLTGGQRRAIQLLHFAVPRHQSDLLIRDNIRWCSVTSLLHPHRPNTGTPSYGERPALIHLVELRQALTCARPMRFLTLTQHGLEIRDAGVRQERIAA
jgi:hypothetical protein